MLTQNSSRSFLLACAIAMLFAARPTAVSADQLLIADRLTNNVYRYSDNGAFLNVVLADNSLLKKPAGITISPDNTKLYVTSSADDSLVQYDYNPLSGTATNGTVIADASKDLSFPNGLKFSQDGSKLYVSNLGGTGVAQLTPSGALAGAPINGLVGGGAYFQFTGLAFAPGGELLVGAFSDFPGFTAGAVAKSDVAITTLGDFITPTPTLRGTTGLMVRGNDLYVTGAYGTPLGNGALLRYDATTGAIDAGFGVYGLASPQAMIPAPDGNGFLMGLLGYSEGTGEILRFDYDGNLLGVFASPFPGMFSEATAFATVVPEPASLALVAVACAALGLAARRRTKR